MSITVLSWPESPSERAQRLADFLPPERLSLLRTVAGEAAARSLPLYLVGGVVRDLLLGRVATDFDLVVEGNAIPFARALAAKHGGKVTAHAPFGTAQWFLPQSIVTHASRLATLDLISSRSETYAHPAALPTVKFGPLTGDLRRRDFTVNALALRLDGDHFGELRDDLGGLDDLRRGLVRVLHPRSFEDDPTRIFRAVRYEQRLGFEIEPETLALIPDALSYIPALSPERVRHELDLILGEEKSASMLARLADLGVLAAVHPVLVWDASIRERFVRGSHVPPEERESFGWMLWLMHLSRPELEEIENRLHFQAGVRDNLLAASKLLGGLGALTGQKPSGCVSILEEFPLEGAGAVALAVPDEEVRQMLANYLETWRHVKPKANGNTLKKMGLEPGPAFQKILWKLRAAWLDGEVKSPEEENALLEKLAEQAKK